MTNIHIRNILNVLVIVGLSLFMVACQQAKTAQEYLAAAQDHYENRDYVTASIELKNSLQLEPDNPVSRALLGRVSLILGQSAAAEKELRRARELDPADSSTTAPFINALVQQGKIGEALRVPLDTLSEADLINVLLSQSAGLISVQRYDDARPKLEQLLSLDPALISALSLKARLEFETGNTPTSRVLLSQVLQLDESYAPAKELEGDIEWAQSNLATAESAYVAALSGGQTVPRLLKLTQVQVLQGKLTEAQTQLSALRKLDTRLPEIRFIEGLIQFEEQNYSDAQLSFEKALVLNPDFLPAVNYLGLTHLRFGNLEQALQYAQSLYNADSTAVNARKLLARVRIAMGDTREATRILQGLIDNGVRDREVNNLLASVLFKTGDMDEAVFLLESGNAGLGLATAISLREADDNGSSVQGSNSLSEADTSQLTAEQLDIANVLRLLGEGEAEKALVETERMKGVYPDSITPLVLSSRAYLTQDNTAAAISELEQAMRISPGNTSAGLVLASLSSQEGNISRAKSVYAQILERYPSNLQALVESARISLAEEDEAGMISTLEKAIELNPGTIEPRVILARYYLYSGDAEKALTVVRDRPVNATTPTGILSLLAEINLALNRFALAKQYLALLTERSPEVAQLRYLYALALRNTGDQERALVEVEQATELDPGLVEAHVLTARIALDMGNQDQYVASRTIIADLAKDNAAAREIIEKLPSFSDLVTMTAELQERRQSGAIPIETDIEKIASSMELQRNSRALWKAGRKEASVTLLEQWVSRYPEDVSVMMTLASAYIQQDQLDKAIDQYKTLLSIDNYNAVALNNLAWYLSDISPVEALGYAGRASELAPTSTSTLDTLAFVQLKNGLSDKAMQTIDTALSLAPENPTLRFRKAAISAESGQADEALALLQSLVNDGPDFAERESAEKLLGALRSGQNTSN